nr:innexin unc 9 [Hymenolepis microstoma]
MAVNLVGGLQDNFSKRHGCQNDQFATLEDFGDRLNRFYTSTVLLILVGVTVTNVYFLKAISCNLSHIPSSPGFTGYTESVCWVQGTIGFDKTDKIPGNETEWNRLREKSDISFYQWVPFCLTVQAILFYIPYLIWQTLSVNTLGDNFNYLVTRAKSVNTANDVASRSKLLQTCAYQLNLLTLQHTDRRHSSWSKFQRSVNRQVSIFFAKRLGNRTAIYYLLTKILYLINCVGQIYLIMYFIGPNTETRSSLITFSMRLFNTTTSQKEWGGSDLFPLQTLCPIRIPELGKRDQLYTAICALPVNMLNVKIYMFLWVWILVVFVVSVISTLIWMARLLITPLNKAFLSNFLEISLFAANSMATNDESNALIPCSGDKLREEAQRFYEEVVGLDGAFLVRMLRLNAGDVVAGEILVAWWELSKNSHQILNVKGTLV